MGLRADLEASLLAPAEAAEKIKLMRAWSELADALDQARRATTNRKIPALHHWLERAAHWFIAVSTLQGIDDMIHSAIMDASTPALAAEIERRARDVNETPASRAEAKRIMRKMAKAVAPKAVKQP